MFIWNWLLEASYTLGSKRGWWLSCLIAAAVTAAIQALPAPWSWIGAAPLVVFIVLLVDGHARWQRDEVRERTRRTGR